MVKATELSIIIPILNEADNLEALLQRINNALYAKGITYEGIIVDDHSTDLSESMKKDFEERYPVRFYVKKGKRGKSYSLLEGFSYANADILSFIDADLQYPPEALPEMYEKVLEGNDIIVANRVVNNTPLLRKIASKSYSFIFNKLLHGINFDVQSGMKMFRSEVIRRLRLDPKPWSFDLEFVLKGHHAGYSIASGDINFERRTLGETKVNLRKVTTELVLSSVKLKLEDFGAIPLLPEEEEVHGKGFHYKGQKFIHHSLLDISEMAFFQLNKYQRILGILFIITLTAAFIINWHFSLLILLVTLSLLYFIDIFFNFFLIFKSFASYPEIKIPRQEILDANTMEWPKYTIFCPLYKEWQVLPQFIKAMSQLDYPRDKLQVMLLLEEEDEESQRNVTQFNLPDYFQVVVVPDSLPKTKPKACNYGLQRADGEFSVIYDAEDIPEVDQLKKTVLAFRKSEENVVCIQAKLNYYNPHQNTLTRIFTAEYSLWFDLILTGLQSISAPIPLGGTSNHFRTADLKKLRGWDPFNVTEDCDLGMRLVKQGYRTAIVDSTTHEEANSSYSNWFGQRSRWIKGYIQSYFVHMRNPRAFSRDRTRPDLYTFQLIVGGKVLSMFINPLFWIMTISYFAFRPFIGPFIESLFPGPILYLGVFSAVVGNFLYFYLYMIGCARRGYYDLIKFGFLVPIYWIMMSVATWIAIYKIITAPHYWFKTKHGLHLSEDKDTVQVPNTKDNKVVDKDFTFLPGGVN